jgi:thiamine transport system substrate-binding protein
VIRRTVAAALAAVAVPVALAACGGESDAPQSITLVVYDSYPSDDADEPNPLQVALDEFTESTGIEVEVLVSSDAGTMLSKATLTAGNPEGDVMWGIDNTLLSRALEAGVFDPYTAKGVDALAPEFTALVPDGEATPVDFGDVCVNYDIAELAARDVAPPVTLADLVKPEYAGMLAVENPATSSPGLAFLLATIAEFGDSGWEDYWRQLTANDVLVVDSWTDAYYSAFSRYDGDRPLVVSYGSSPPVEVLFSEEPLTAAPTGVAAETCFRQVEFAGVLTGTKAPEAAHRLLDFLVSERYQRELPLNLFVFPVNPDVELQPEFTEYATIPDQPYTLDPAQIDANRADWTDRWTAIAG